MYIMVYLSREQFFLTLGNGTQAAFKSDPNVLYISLHRFGLYPEDKTAKSRRYCGEGEGLGK
jgi:acetoin utilization deacetylase AcuC-like enzyme